MILSFKLVMDEYDTTLWRLLKNTTLPNAADIPINVRMALLSTVLDALIFIQANNYCHLDIKPSNVLLNLTNGEWNGRDLVLSDFGLASSSNALTGQCGTPGFGSPEQFVGAASLTSDNFAFGKMCILLIFKWQTGWNLLAKPILQDKTDPISATPLREMKKHISKLLHVSHVTSLKEKNDVVSQVSFPANHQSQFIDWLTMLLGTRRCPFSGERYLNVNRQIGKVKTFSS